MSIDASTIVSYVDTGLLIAFIAILVILVLAFLRGLLRGWRYGTYRFIFIAILVVASFLLVGPIATGVGAMEISQWVGTSISLTINGKTAVIPVSNAFSTLKEGAAIILKDCFDITASPAELVSYATALATSILRGVAFLLEMILVWILGSLLCTLLWHIAFKHFIPKPKRKKKTLRVVSGLQEFVATAVVGVLLLTPLTGTVNALKNRVNLTDETVQKNETAKLVNDVLTTYDNSILAKVFFTWTGGEGNDTLDTQLLQFITDTEVENFKGSFISDLKSLATLANTAVNLYFGNSNEQGIAWKSLLTAAEIPELFSTIADTPLIQVALPFAVKVAISMDQVIEVLGSETVDYLKNNDITWSKELDNLGKIYSDVVESGLFDFVKDEYSQSPTIIFDSAYDVLFGTEKVKKSLVEISKDAEKSQVMNRLICGLAYTMANKPEQAKDDDPKTIQLIDLFPKKADGSIDYDKSASYNWFDEVSIIYNALYTIKEGNPDAVKQLIDKVVTGIESSGSSSVAFAIEDVTAFISDPTSFSACTEAFIGPRTNAGDPIADESGISKNRECLLDSALVYNVLPELLPFLATNLSTMAEVSTISATTLDDVNKELLTGTEGQVRVKFKEELGHVFDVIGKMNSTAAGSAFLKSPDKFPGIHSDPEGNLHSIDAGLLDAAGASARALDDSKVMKVLIPELADGMLQKTGLLTDYGITADFTCDNLGEEVAHLIDIARYCMGAVSEMTALTQGMDVNKLGDFLENNSVELAHLLDIICSSKILNPEILGEKNTNIKNMLEKLFSTAGLTGFSLEDGDIPTDKDLFGVWEGATLKTAGETSYLVNALVDISSTGILSKIDSFSTMTSSEQIAVLGDIDIAELFSDIGGSTILSRVLSRTFDKMLIESVLSASKYEMEDEISFTSLTTKEDWEKEGVSFQAIIDCAINGIDLSNFDLFGSGGTAIADLITNLAKSRIFYHKLAGVDEYEYTFPKYLYNRLLDSLESDMVQDYFGDQGIVKSSSSLDLDQKKAITTMLWANFEAVSSSETTFEGHVTAWTSATGPLAELKAVIQAASRFGGLSLASIDGENLGKAKVLLYAVNDSALFGGIVIPNALASALSQFNDDSAGLNFSSANVDWFWGKDKTTRSTEINTIMSVVDAFLDSTYGVWNGSSIDTSKLNLGNISTEYFLKPVLKGMANSEILFNAKAGASSSVFKQVLTMFVRSSGLYGSLADNDTPISSITSGNGRSTMTINSIIAGTATTRAEWLTEIDNLADLLDLIKASSFMSSSGQINFDVLSNPTEYFATNKEAKCEELVLILKSLDNSELLRRVLPMKLNDALSGDLLGSGNVYGDDLKLADAFCNQTNTTLSGEHDWAPYGDEEIENLILAMSCVGGLAGIDPNDLTTIDPVSLTDALAAMAKTRIFNSQKNGVAPRANLTCVQAFVMDLLSNDAFQPYFYDAKSPKDIHYADIGQYSDGVTKAYYLAKTNLGTVDTITAEQLALINGETKSLRSTLKTLLSEEFAALFSSGSIDFSSITPSMFSQMLRAFNSTPYFCDVVPNSIGSVIKNPANGYTVPGIDLMRGNFYFAYYWVNPDGTMRTVPFTTNNENWNARFPEAEIDQIATIMGIVKKNSALISSFDINTIDPLVIHDLLLGFYNSYVFHCAGPETRAVALAGDSQIVTVSKTGGGSTTINDITVFQQLVYKIYDESTLSKQAYSSVYDLSLYLDYGANGYKVKLRDKIVGYDDALWLEEIQSLTTDGLYHAGTESDPYVGLFEVIQRTGILSEIGGGGSVSVDSASLMKLNPLKIRGLLLALNDCDIVSDVLPYSIQSMVTSSGDDGLGLSKYTGNTVALADEADALTIPASFALGNDFLTTMNVSFLYSGDASSGFYAKIDLDNDGVFETTLDKSFTPTSSALSPTYVVDTSKLPARFALYPVAGGSGNFTNVVASVETSNFLLGQAAYEVTGIPAVFDFLTSTYRGVSSDPSDTSIYFSMGNVNNSLKEFIDDPYSEFTHSTYGILSLFGTSGFFDHGFALDGTLSSTPSYTSFDLALYNILGVKLTMSGAPVSVSLGDNIGAASAASEAERYAIMHDTFAAAGEFNVYKEAAYIDQFIMDAGYVEAYAKVLNSAGLNGTTLLMANYFMNSNSEKALNLLSSRSYSYTIDVYAEYDAGGNTPIRHYVLTEPGVIGTNIIYGQSKSLYSGEYKGTQISDHYAGRPSTNYATKDYSDGISSVCATTPDTYTMVAADFTNLIEAEKRAFEALAAIYDGLDITDASTFGKMTDSAKIAAAKTAFDNLVVTPGKPQQFVDCFYIASLYDILVIRQYFAIQSSAPYALTDFPSTIADGYENAAIDYMTMTYATNKSFSYGNIANVIAA